MIPPDPHPRPFPRSGGRGPVFHTNDMHGRLDAMARLSHLARRLQAEAAAEGRPVFFWDAGDAADRRIDWISATKGSLFPPVLHDMGITLQTLGNAISLPYRQQAASAMAHHADFPILAASFRNGDGPLAASASGRWRVRQ